MNVRIMDFLPVRTARAGEMRRYVLMTSTKRMPVDFQNARPPTAPTLSLKNRTSARPADSSLITLSACPAAAPRPQDHDRRHQ
jgi:hypothetical protein